MEYFTRADVKAEAKQYVRANYWPLVGAGLLLALATTGGGSGQSGSENSGSGYEQSQQAWEQISHSSMLGWVISLGAAAIIIAILIKVFLLDPLEYGSRNYFKKSVDGTAKGTMACGYWKENYMRVVKTFFRRDLFIFLWSLLLVIPGLVKYYEYYFVPYLTEDYPDQEPEDILAMSKQMTDGRKWELFVFDLSYLGWHLLGMVTFGLVEVLWTLPYNYMGETVLYQKLVKADTDDSGSEKVYDNTNKASDYGPQEAAAAPAPAPAEPEQPAKEQQAEPEKPAEPAPAPEKPQEWICPQCGTKNTGAYCGECGTKRPE